MAASAFLVQLPETSGRTLKNRVNAVVVWAEDATDAKALGKAAFSGISNAIWNGATATALVVPTELEGHRLQVRVLDTLGDPLDDYAAGVGEDNSWVEVTAGDTDDIDDMGTDMATAINAAYASIANAAYDTGTNVLTAAAIADNIGTHTLQARMYLPEGGSYGEPDIAIPSFIGTITHEGAAGAALTVVLNARFTALFAKVTV